LTGLLQADFRCKREKRQFGLLAAIRCGCTLNQREIGKLAAAVPDKATFPSLCLDVRFGFITTQLGSFFRCNLNPLSDLIE
jgi:hypothetical protein